jgi:hypothetical protein
MIPLPLLVLACNALTGLFVCFWFVTKKKKKKKKSEVNPASGCQDFGSNGSRLKKKKKINYLKFFKK